MAADDRNTHRPAGGAKWALAGLVVVLIAIAAFAGLFAGIAVISSLVWLVLGAAVVAIFVGVYRWRRKRGGAA